MTTIIDNSPQWHRFIPADKNSKAGKFSTSESSAIYNQQLQFQKELRARQDYLELSRPYFTPAQKEFAKTYDNLWKELNFPEEIKPQILFTKMDAITPMGFCANDYTILVNKNPFLLKVLKATGLDRQYLRHEIRHAEQFQQIVQTLGTKELLNYITKHKSEFLQTVSIPDCLMIEETLGRIPKDSKQGKQSIEFLKCMTDYTEVNLTDLLNTFKAYKTQIIEKDARLAEKAFAPSTSQIIKRGIKFIYREFIKKVKR